MIIDYQFQKKNNAILLGIRIENAVLDFVTDENILRKSLEILNQEGKNNEIEIGKFGNFPVTLYRHRDGSASLFIDGPIFDDNRIQSSAIWISKEELSDIIGKVLANNG